jgi:starch synthase (maltosyl-transferring)
MPDNATIPYELPRRVIIESVTPEIEGGRFPVKRVLADLFTVEADIFADGHDTLAAALLYRAEGDADWTEVPMEPLVNDRWRASFRTTRLGACRYTVVGWVDRFRSWRRDFRKKLAAGQDVSLDLQAGAALAKQGSTRASGKDAGFLRQRAAVLVNADLPVEGRAGLAIDEAFSAAMDRHPDRRLETRYGRELEVWVEPELARFSAWYELFPRSFADEPGKHGTLRDVERQLDRVVDLGFDVLYLPPIHPIGKAFRKGRNNHPKAEPDEPGSPWGIGAEAGGHKAVHPELGTIEDLERLVAVSRDRGIEIALDIAFQCSPDHPWVAEHPEWFTKRPDGSIQYAENPPKKYQDIYPLNFESSDWEGLWRELKSVFEFWIARGVRVFRVDNPHTKALPFWEWVIRELKRSRPDVILLSEAFTRPRVMHYLAKAGFTQSYNYFPWRNTQWELTQFMTELTRTQLKEFFRPNLWPNTPDILPQYLQYGGRPAFIARLVLAATLGASYGIYGPAYELCENEPREPGAEEYLHSEKYEIRKWNLDAPGNLGPIIRIINRVRRENPALRTNDTLQFHPTDNEQILCYSKQSEDGENIVLVAVNLDPHHTQSGWVTLDLSALAIETNDTFQLHEQLTGARYLWSGPRNFVEMAPQFTPAQIFRVRRRIRKEEDFDYFL